jgi:hypothetical protein
MNLSISSLPLHGIRPIRSMWISDAFGDVRRHFVDASIHHKLIQNDEARSYAYGQ